MLLVLVQVALLVQAQQLALGEVRARRQSLRPNGSRCQAPGESVDNDNGQGLVATPTLNFETQTPPFRPCWSLQEELQVEWVFRWFSSHSSALKKVDPSKIESLVLREKALKMWWGRVFSLKHSLGKMLIQMCYWRTSSLNWIFSWLMLKPFHCHCHTKLLLPPDFKR